MSNNGHYNVQIIMYHQPCSCCFSSGSWRYMDEELYGTLKLLLRCHSSVQMTLCGLGLAALLCSP